MTQQQLETMLAAYKALAEKLHVENNGLKSVLHALSDSEAKLLSRGVNRWKFDGKTVSHGYPGISPKALVDESLIDGAFVLAEFGDFAAVVPKKKEDPSTKHELKG